MKIYFTLLALICTLTINAQWLDGPDAPDATYQFNGSEFEFTISNPPSSNNYMENYMEMDYPITSARPDSFYRFQGYLIYQIFSFIDLVAFFNSNQQWEEYLSDFNRTRLVAQCDLADTTINFVNNFFDSTNMQCSSSNIIYNAANTGITHNFTITQDAFNGVSFIPGNQYCFIFLAYAVNGYHNDLDCSLPRPVKISTKGANGLITVLCLDPATAGINDSQMNNLNIYYQEGIIINSTHKGIFNLISADGKTVFSRNINGNTNIDTENFAGGIYFFRFETENGIKTGKLFIPAN